MNLGHLHLILNHLPVLGIPFGLILYAAGTLRRNEEMKRYAAFFTVVVALLTIPAYLTGEPAEKLVEHLPGVAESLIEKHEEAAEVSLVLTLFAGAFAGLTLLFRHPKFDRLSSTAFVLALVVSGISLGYTANLGGEIRHSEIRASAGAGNPLTQPDAKEADED